MRLDIVKAAIWVAGAVRSCAAPAIASADPVFTVAFGSSGRACQGGLYVRTKTLDWITTYQVCKAMRYEVLEKDLTGNPQRIVFRTEKRSRQCSMEVFELSQADPRVGKWDASAYPSLEAYQKRNEPGWIDSLDPHRQALDCMMFELDRPSAR